MSPATEDYNPKVRIEAMQQNLQSQKQMWEEISHKPQSKEKDLMLANLLLLNKDAQQLWAVEYMLDEMNNHNNKKIYDAVNREYEAIGNNVREALGIKDTIWVKMDQVKDELKKERQQLANLAQMTDGFSQKSYLVTLLTVNENSRQLLNMDRVMIESNMPVWGMESLSKQEKKQVRNFYADSDKEYKELNQEIKVMIGIEQTQKKGNIFSRMFK